MEDQVIFHSCVYLFLKGNFSSETLPKLPMLDPWSHAGVKAPGQILLMKQQTILRAVAFYYLLFS